MRLTRIQGVTEGTVKKGLKGVNKGVLLFFNLAAILVKAFFHFQSLHLNNDDVQTNRQGAANMLHSLYNVHQYIGATNHLAQMYY